jgi:hypothetical protein
MKFGMDFMPYMITSNTYFVTGCLIIPPWRLLEIVRWSDDYAITYCPLPHVTEGGILET